jgi:exodeoxyribonuclease VII large subunit
MLHIIHRRFENVPILLYPARVQGEGAAREIVGALDFFNVSTNVEVIILARGGGSLEDLWTFNEEAVARAIHRSRIPVISAVGHETDYTISDFVADLRAPTPSAAAELVVKDKREMRMLLRHLEERLEGRVRQRLQTYQTDLAHFRKTLIDPRRRITENLLKVDDLVYRFRTLTSWAVRRKSDRHSHLSERLCLQNPAQKLKNLRMILQEIARRIRQNLRHSIDIERQKMSGILGRLDSLSPLSILQRGYSITRKLPSMEVLRSVDSVHEGDRVEVRLFHGRMICGVETKIRS